MLEDSSGTTANQPPGARLQQALKLHLAGDKPAAERVYRAILEADPNQPDALHLLGLIEYGKKNLQSAASLIERAIKINPEKPGYLMDLGNVFRAQGDLRRAAESYLQVLRFNPQSAETYVNLGNVFQDSRKLEDAAGCYSQACALKPDLIGAHESLGNAFRKLNRFDEALLAYGKALALNPERPSTHYNLAVVKSELGRFDEALEHCRRCLELHMDCPDRVLFHQGMVELVRGDFAAGWSHYERRFGSPDCNTPSRSYPQPVWGGEKLPTGHLFIWGEQGIGEEIMFAGLLPEVLQTGNRCVLECDSRLQPLFARSFPSVRVLSRPADVKAINVGAHIPCGSLARLFRSTEAAFGAAASSYLAADSAQRQRLRARYDDGRLLVGLAWKTSSPKSGHLRSIPLEALTRLFRQGGIKLMSLQYGAPNELAAEAKAAGLSLAIDRQVDQFANLDLFAAQVSAMDLVISIDNSAAHMAGALGVPVWLLLPLVPDWRWQLEREDSPWYPSVRIFRQRRVADWQPVLSSVQEALAFLRGRP